MDDKTQNTLDVIEDSEYVRRFFDSINYDEDRGKWSINTFALRNLKHPEYSLSVTRCIIVEDPYENARNIFSTKKLPRIKGYTTLLASDIRKIKLDNITLKLLADLNLATGHAGIYTWLNDTLVEGEVENPILIELKKELFKIAFPTYTNFDSNRLLSD